VNAGDVPLTEQREDLRFALEPRDAIRIGHEPSSTILMAMSQPSSVSPQAAALTRGAG